MRDQGERGQRKRDIKREGNQGVVGQGKRGSSFEEGIMRRGFKVKGEIKENTRSGKEVAQGRRDQENRESREGRSRNQEKRGSRVKEIEGRGIKGIIDNEKGASRRRESIEHFQGKWERRHQAKSG